MLRYCAGISFKKEDNWQAYYENSAEKIFKNIWLGNSQK
jgi:hypothetical protein